VGEGREESEEEQVGAGPAAARAHLLTWRRAGAGGLVDTVLGTPGLAQSSERSQDLVSLCRRAHGLIGKMITTAPGPGLFDRSVERTGSLTHNRPLLRLLP